MLATYGDRQPEQVPEAIDSLELAWLIHQIVGKPSNSAGANRPRPRCSGLICISLSSVRRRP